MGVDYYIFDHKNSTFYQLGKGSWFELKDKMDILNNPDTNIFLEFVEKDAEYNLDLEMKDYYRQIGVCLHNFFKDTPTNQLYICGDSGDELFYARCLKYNCVGSRYDYGNDAKNKENIDFCNRHQKENNKRLYDIKNLSKSDIIWLKNNGWSFAKVKTIEV